jgi:hypothetical protein
MDTFRNGLEFLSALYNSFRHLPLITNARKISHISDIMTIFVAVASDVYIINRRADIVLARTTTFAFVCYFFDNHSVTSLISAPHSEQNLRLSDTTPHLSHLYNAPPTGIQCPLMRSGCAGGNCLIASTASYIPFTHSFLCEFAS